jgi:hypothetical protein
MPRLVLLLIVGLESNFVIHANPMNLGSDVDEWEIETVTVIGRHDCRLAFPDMLEPAPYESRLAGQLWSFDVMNFS